MKRATLLVAAVVIAAALAIAATRPTSSTSTTSTTAPPVTAAALAATEVPQVSRADVMDQRDHVTAVERGRIRRTRLLDTTLVTAAVAHGVSILTGPARPSDRAPQTMVVTPAPGLTVREIADGVSRICRALRDPCRTSDYRFLIQTPSGQAPLPARLIDPTPKD